ncbi:MULTISPECIES: hypothetical protein [unclassified Modestobacter]|uniref:hypothetical protein n=1 Tax=unclassified Modestobacter TaxID=2643866 RepID=UPI0022AA8EB4|nr:MULTISPECIES: hypothetical protein [unclassified Modestobacter]MCZ2826051.1 hypothetical protein [Modestobacter sp. VKM Ac-2981]MCZ2852884.1 hypothetical protein [Modestobacter sp. VKM Ac-2982]
MTEPANGALPLCPALLLDGSTCLLPLGEEPCLHRDPGSAPAALADLVATLRGQVEEARTVAMSLASLARYLRGQRAVDLVCERMGVGAQPAWLEPSLPGWPLPAVPRPAS